MGEEWSADRVLDGELRWEGHVARMGEEWNADRVLNGELKGKGR
jgi:hypothetical protein